MHLEKGIRRPHMGRCQYKIIKGLLQFVIFYSTVIAFMHLSFCPFSAECITIKLLYKMLSNLFSVADDTLLHEHYNSDLKEKIHYIKSYFNNSQSSWI